MQCPEEEDVYDDAKYMPWKTSDITCGCLHRCQNERVPRIIPEQKRTRLCKIPYCQCQNTFATVTSQDNDHIVARTREYPQECQNENSQINVIVC